MAIKVETSLPWPSGPSHHCVAVLPISYDSDERRPTGGGFLGPIRQQRITVTCPFAATIMVTVTVLVMVTITVTATMRFAESQAVRRGLAASGTPSPPLDGPQPAPPLSPPPPPPPAPPLWPTGIAGTRTRLRVTAALEGTERYPPALPPHERVVPALRPPSPGGGETLHGRSADSVPGRVARPAPAAERRGRPAAVTRRGYGCGPDRQDARACFALATRRSSAAPPPSAQWRRRRVQMRLSRAEPRATSCVRRPEGPAGTPCAGRSPGAVRLARAQPGANRAPRGCTAERRQSVLSERAAARGRAGCDAAAAVAAACGGTCRGGGDPAGWPGPGRACGGTEVSERTRTQVAVPPTSLL
jgi:hypothetical protein